MKKDQFEHITDQELLERFYSDNKDNRWLGVLLQRYTLLLLGVSMKYLKNAEEAKDSVQQIFLKVITELPKTRVTYFKSWLYMVAKNYCLMQLRDKKNKQFNEIKDNILVETDDTQSYKNELKEKDELLQLIEESLPTLNEEQQICVKLFYLEKQSYQEISDVTGYTLLQVKSYIQNGKRNLKILVEKKLNKL